MKVKTYDVKSYELAERFLRGEPADEEDRKNLAIHIQTAIEEWFEDWVRSHD